MNNQLKWGKPAIKTIENDEIKDTILTTACSAYAHEECTGGFEFR